MQDDSPDVLIETIAAFREILANTDWRQSRRMHDYFRLVHEVGGEDALLRAVLGSPEGEASRQDRLLRAFHEDRSGPVRAWALTLLARGPADGWLPVLLNRLIDPEYVGPLALEALGAGDWSLSHCALQILADLPDRPGTASTLHRIASDPSAARERRLWAVHALQQIGEDRAAPARGSICCGSPSPMAYPTSSAVRSSTRCHPKRWRWAPTSGG